MAAYEEDGYFETQDLKLYWCKAGHGPINLLFTSGTLGKTLLDSLETKLLQKALPKTITDNCAPLIARSIRW